MRKNATWGGNLELQAISLEFEVNIVVHQLDQPRWEISNHDDPKTQGIHLS
jgi:hypothetical protein